MIDCTVWWSTPLAVDDNYRDYLTFLDQNEHDRYLAYRKDIDRHRFLTGRVLAKTAIGEHLGKSPQTITFDASCMDCGKQHGPPRVPGEKISLSISHSGQRVGVAVSEDVKLGLDVEATSRRVSPQLAAYALNGTELAVLTQTPEREKAKAFFTYWTRKEALMKASGRGLRIPLRGLTVSAPDLPPRLDGSQDSSLNPAHAQLLDLNPGPGYHGALAVLTGEKIAAIEHFWGSPQLTPRKSSTRSKNT